MQDIPMLAIEQAIESTKKEESYRRFVYQCTKKRWTVGYGRNVQDNGVSEPEAEYLLKNDIFESFQDLNHIFPPALLLSFPTEVQRVLIEMRFQMGSGSFRGFKNMIAAAKRKDWPGMIREMKDSDWYREDTPARARRVVNLVELVR